MSTAGTTSERDAFAALRFDWARMPDDVWKPSPVHVEGLHAAATRHILGGIEDASVAVDTSPVGVVIRGQAGVGKTHLLGWVREQAQRAGGYFLLVGSPSETAFWENVAGAMRSDLLREVHAQGTQGQGTQLAVFLRRLSAKLGVPDSVRDGVAGDTELGPTDLKDFIVAFLGGVERRLRECQDTLRALVLFNAADFETQHVGESFLMSMEEQEPGERASRGMRSEARAPRQVVADISRLLALTGPTVIAVDQIDTVVAVRTTSSKDSSGGEQTPATTTATPEFDKLADGLVVLRDLTARTLLVVSCLPATWAVFEQEAVGPVADRFRAPAPLGRIDSEAIGREIVAKHFGACYARIGFAPPYPTWPVAESAFKQAPEYTPRGLLKRIYRHVEACLTANSYVVLDQLDEDAVRVGKPPSKTTPNTTDFASLDAAFAQLRKDAEGSAALTQDREDIVVPALLRYGLTAWKAERGTAGQAFSLDSPPGPRPALHARLRLSLDESTGDEMHWSFRAVTAKHGNAALTRIRDACTQSGLAHPGNRRRLFLLRNTDWSQGARNREALDAFAAAGGVSAQLSDDDMTTFAALGRLLSQNHPDLQEWLVARQWASRTQLFSAALADAVTAAPTPTPTPPPAPTPLPAPAPTPAPKPTPPPTPTAPVQPVQPAGPTSIQLPSVLRPAQASRFTVGADTVNQQPVDVQLEMLRRHTAIFAGSGSGKTVLIRRIVEECALRGVSSIVLDPNNDLARLGEAWPRPPSAWSAEDASLAKEYIDQTDVVVWTPRVTAGRPLAFQPLPDFQSVRENPDELNLALDAAMATLAGKAGVAGTTPKAKLGRAIIRSALGYFARGNRTRLASFVELLADLPDGVTNLDPTGKLARGLAQTLEAEMIIDPMFGGKGAAADPSMLLTPVAGKRARVSVISFVGLPGAEQRQSFVNQLQLALFAWAKRHPANDRPLGALFVMDEAQTFAPTSGVTPCTRSTLMLSSQIRKYGVGLVFATQAPKNLHSQVSGNAATQFFGLLSAPVHIEAAKQMARSKGGDASQIGRLKVGQFYAVSEGVRFRKLQTPLCLSHHPNSPLTEDEVVERARNSARD